MSASLRRDWLHTSRRPRVAFASMLHRSRASKLVAGRAQHAPNASIEIARLAFQRTQHTAARRTPQLLLPAARADPPHESELPAGSAPRSPAPLPAVQAEPLRESGLAAARAQHSPFPLPAAQADVLHESEPTGSAAPLSRPCFRADAAAEVEHYFRLMANCNGAVLRDESF